MSSRDCFWFLAGVLVTVAVLVTLRPWLRERPTLIARSAIPDFAVPVAAALGLIGVALGIYFLLGSPDSVASAHGSTVMTGSTMSSASAGSSAQMSESSANAGALDEVTQKLANRLATGGGTDSEWQLLAESYDYMGRTADAKAARAHKATAVPLSSGVLGGDASAAVGAAGGSDGSASASFDGQTMAAVADALDNSSGHGTPSDVGISPRNASASASGSASSASSAGSAAWAGTATPAGSAAPASTATPANTGK